MDGLNAVLCNNLCINFFLAGEDSLADTLYKYEVTGNIIELCLLCDGERNDTPVDTVAAVALGSVLVADVGIPTKNLLAGSGLLAGGAVTGLVGEYA